ncbi:MAG: hypothetical protein GY943_38530 [Chloroflexi bacterium]|nr:hypothetical protein [Chloroflexota bacterium]
MEAVGNGRCQIPTATHNNQLVCKYHIYSIITDTTSLGSSIGWYYVYVYTPQHLSQQSSYNLQAIFPDQIDITPSTPLPPCTPTATLFPELPAECDDAYPLPAWGSYVIVFENGTKITPGEVTEQVYTTIPPGTYKVFLASYDDDHDGNPPDTQDNEIWKLLFFNDGEEFFAESGTTSDLLVSQCDEQLVNSSLILTDTVAFVMGEHRLSNNSNTDSIIPYYAVLAPIQMVEIDNNINSTPSATPSLERILITPTPGIN